MDSLTDAGGGDTPLDRKFNPYRHPATTGFSLTNDETWALVFFLHCLTDPRDQAETAPFDHSDLRGVNGYDAEFSENGVHVPKTP